MKGIARFFVRIIIFIIYLLFLWPLFLYGVSGNKKYKLKKKTVIISNHFSDYDIFYIYLLYGFKHHLTFVAYEGVKIGLSKIFAFAFDTIIVYEDQLTNTKIINNMISVLKSGGILVIFPEGYIDHERDYVQKFYESYLFIAKMSQSVILPLSMYPEVAPFKIAKIHIGDEISQEEINNINRKELNKKIRKDIYNNLIDMHIEMQIDQEE